MRILVTPAEWFPDWKGGHGRVATCTAVGLAARGHDVTALVPRTNGHPAVTEQEGVRVVRALPRNRLPVLFTDFVGARAFGSRRRRSFDLVVGHAVPSTSGIFAAGVDAPLVWVYHSPGLRELQYHRAKTSSRTRRAVMRALEPPFARLEHDVIERAQRVLTLSDYTRSILTHDYPSSEQRAARVTGGVDADRFTPGDGVEAARRRLGVAHDGPLLVSVRRLVPRMGLDRLLGAVRELDRPDLRLAVVGTGPLEGELHALADELGIADRVDLVGMVSDDALVDWYRAADLFVLPTVAYEGFGMVTVEALACGTPVVGTPVGATPELLQPLDPRLVSASAETPDLAAAIAEALAIAGDDLRRRCRAYACERYAWDPVVERWETALVETVAAAS